MSKHYLNDTEMEYQVILSKGRGRITKELYGMFDLLCNNIIKKFYYQDYELLKDCRGDAFLHMCLTYWRYDEEKYNSPIAFYTEIFKRSVALSLNKWTHKKNGVAPKRVSITALSNF